MQRRPLREVAEKTYRQPLTASWRSNGDELRDQRGQEQRYSQYPEFQDRTICNYIPDLRIRIIRSSGGTAPFLESLSPLNEKIFRLP